MDLNLGSTRALIDECRRQGLLRNQCAYVLATVWHETAQTMKPIYERGAKAYFNKYEPGTKIGKQLGNTLKGDGYLYRGRGFVQLTGRANYAKYGLTGNPDKALDPKMAAEIAVAGMRFGRFTGKKLSDYLTTDKTDFIAARRIINGQDKAQLIANHARDYDMDLQTIGYSQKKAPAKQQQPASARPAAPAPLVAIEPKPSPAPVPVTDKELIKRVQTGLALLNYNPGGADGTIGPLTAGAIRVFRADNGLPEGAFVDDALIAALASAKPREMVPARANATAAQVGAVVPEVRANAMTKIGAAVVAVPGAVYTLGINSLDYIGVAKQYIQPLQEAAYDVPGSVWIGIITALAVGLAFWSRHGEKKGVEAYKSGDRR